MLSSYSRQGLDFYLFNEIVDSHFKNIYLTFLQRKCFSMFVPHV